MNFGTNILPLLIAFVSVLTWAIPLIRDELRPDVSKVAVAVSRASRDRIYLIGTNAGKRSGSIAGAAIISVGRTMLRVPIILEGDQSLRFLKPGEEKEIAFGIPPSRQSDLARLVRARAGRSDALPHGSRISEVPADAAAVGLIVRMAQSDGSETRFASGMLMSCRDELCYWGISVPEL